MSFFAKYAVVHESSLYKLGTIGGDATLYSKNCKETEVIFYPSLVKKGYRCVSCEAIRSQKIHTINSILNRRAHKFEKAAVITTTANLSPTDIIFIKSSVK